MRNLYLLNRVGAHRYYNYLLPVYGKNRLLVLINFLELNPREIIYTALFLLIFNLSLTSCSCLLISLYQSNSISFFIYITSLPFSKGQFTDKKKL